jgi:hypothetical protein
LALIISFDSLVVTQIAEWTLGDVHDQDGALKEYAVPVDVEIMLLSFGKSTDN